MHFWRNPHHADKIMYDEWQKNSGRLARLIEYFRQLPTPKSNIVTTQSTRSGKGKGPEIQTKDPETQTKDSRSRYVFVKIPKKIGDKLEPNYGNEAPEGYGIYFEEGFRVHRLLFVILLFYFICSIVVIIWVLKMYGVVGPSTWGSLFAVLAWFTSFFALLLTVWFKWAESS